MRSKVEYAGQGPLPEFLQPAWGDPTFLRAGGMGLLLARETDLDRRWTVGQKIPYRPSSMISLASSSARRCCSSSTE